MLRYAIAEISGYQFRIEEGGRIRIPRVNATEGDKITLDKILLASNDGKVTVGAPFINGAQAEAKVLEHVRNKKVLIVKKKRRKGYKRTSSARQHLTTLEISKLSV